MPDNNNLQCDSIAVPRAVCATSNDPYLQSRILPGWAQDYVQLSRGAFEGGVAHAPLENVHLFREWINRAIDQKSVASNDIYMIGVTLHDGPSSWQNRNLDEKSMFILRPGEEAFFSARKNSEMIAATIDAQYLESFSQKLYGRNLSQLLRSRHSIPMKAEGLNHFKKVMIQGLNSCLERPDIIGCQTSKCQLSEEVAVAALNVIANSTSEKSESTHNHRVHRALVQRTKIFVLENPGSNPTVEALCSYLGMSRRGLHTAFMQVLGINPCTYLRTVRLHLARNEILSGCPSVAEAALRWGFWHFGMFSQYYKQLFGELPSMTYRHPPSVTSL